MTDQVQQKLKEKLEALVKQRDELRDQISATEGAMQALMWAMTELAPPSGANAAAQEGEQDDRNPPNP